MEPMSLMKLRAAAERMPDGPLKDEVKHWIQTLLQKELHQSKKQVSHA